MTVIARRERQWSQEQECQSPAVPDAFVLHMLHLLFRQLKTKPCCGVDLAFRREFLFACQDKTVAAADTQRHLRENVEFQRQRSRDTGHGIAVTFVVAGDVDRIAGFVGLDGVADADGDAGNLSGNAGESSADGDAVAAVCRVDGIACGVLTDDGVVTEYFGVCRDISEIKTTEERLALETAKAQDVETVKNAFLRNMSYEIRTPLSSVVGFAELFDMPHQASDEALFIQQIKDNSSQLLQLINDILFLSRLDAHMIEFKAHPVDFANFFKPRCETAWLHGRRAGVSYVVDSPYRQLVVEVDDLNIGHLVDQIIANAVEHTTSGMVRASYDYTGEELVMSFQDTGCGIPEERMATIFERFGKRSNQGTGLGMSICYELSRQMGGRITVKSTVGVGTIVWVSIPCKCTEIVRN